MNGAIREKVKIFDRDAIKYIAVTVMVLGHFLIFTIREPIMANFPRPLFRILFIVMFFAPPTFFFFISEGFRYTRSKAKYAKRLFIVALITQFTFTLANSGTLLTWSFFTEWNVFMTLFLGLSALNVWEKGWKLPLRIVAILAIIAASVLLGCEWEIWGILVIFGFHIFREKPIFRFVWYISAMLLLTAQSNSWSLNVFSWSITEIEIMLVFLLAYLAVTVFYNDKRGKFTIFSKYFFYVVYPIHYLAIFLFKEIS